MKKTFAIKREPYKSFKYKVALRTEAFDKVFHLIHRNFANHISSDMSDLGDNLTNYFYVTEDAVREVQNRLKESGFVKDSSILKESAKMKTLSKILSEVLNEDFRIEIGKVDSGNLTVLINGKKYLYHPIDGTTADELGTKVEQLAKHSQGRALAWLKKNSKLVGGGKGMNKLEHSLKK